MQRRRLLWLLRYSPGKFSDEGRTFSARGRCRRMSQQIVDANGPIRRTRRHPSAVKVHLGIVLHGARDRRRKDSRGVDNKAKERTGLPWRSKQRKLQKRTQYRQSTPSAYETSLTIMSLWPVSKVATVAIAASRGEHREHEGGKSKRCTFVGRLKGEGLNFSRSLERERRRE